MQTAPSIFGSAVDELNRADPDRLPDLLRAIPVSGFGVTTTMGFGDWMLAVASKVNQAALSVAAAATVTIAGTPHAGDITTITVDGIAVTNTSLTLAVKASGTVQLASCRIGDVVNVVVNGETISYNVGSTNATTEATALKVALNADPTFAALFLASSATDTVTITTLAYGAAGNAYTLTTNIGGLGHTTTATASGATLASGVTGDTVTTIAAALKASINAHAVLGLAWLATNVAGVLTITAKRKGTGANAKTLVAAVTGGGATVTATAQAATFGLASAGTGLDDMLSPVSTNP